MRQIYHRLHGSLEYPIPHFIDQQRQQNRNGKANQYFPETQRKRVSHNPDKIWCPEKLFKIVQAAPRTSEGPHKNLVVLEGNKII